MLRPSSRAAAAALRSVGRRSSALSLRRRYHSLSVGGDRVWGLPDVAHTTALGGRTRITRAQLSTVADVPPARGAAGFSDGDPWWGRAKDYVSEASRRGRPGDEDRLGHLQHLQHLQQQQQRQRQRRPDRGSAAAQRHPSRQRNRTPAPTLAETPKTINVSGLVNQAVIRRLARARRRKNWRAALTELDAIDREISGGGGGGGDGGGVGGGLTWSVRGLSHEAEERARTTVYNIVVDVLGARKRWQEAFALMETMQERGVAVDIFTLNSVLKACGAAGQVELTLSLLREMRLRNPSAPSPRPTSVNGPAGTVDRLLLLPVPDVISFNIALAACARAGRTSLALSLLDEMVRGNAVGSGGVVGGLVRGRDNGIGDGFSLSPAPVPNLASYNSALSACGRCESEKDGGLERAFEILEAMRRGDGGAPSPDMVTYKELIIACGRAGHWRQALSWLDTATDEGLRPTAAVFCEVITACGRGGAWHRALSVLREDMPAHGVTPDKFCFNMALRACADAGEVKQALEILDHSLSMRGANGFSYSSILDALARQGDPDLAVRVLREIEPTTGHRPNCWHYGAVFLAYLHSGDECGAMAIQSEWRASHNQGAVDRLRASGGYGGGAGCDGASAGAGEAVAAPGERFDPADLLALSGANADVGNWAVCLDVLETAKEVSRVARIAVTAKSNELLLAKDGLGLASWRATAARSSKVTARAKEAACALRGCYEGAVEALGRAGRWEQALSLLAEGANALRREDLRLDESCFIPALRACCARDGDTVVDSCAAGAAPKSVVDGLAPQDGKVPQDGKPQRDSKTRQSGKAPQDGKAPQQRCDVSPFFLGRQTGEGEESNGGRGRHQGGVLAELTATAAVFPGSEGERREDGAGRAWGESVGPGDPGGASSCLCDAVRLLRRMENEAGVAPGAWGVNVVIEAAVRERQWGLASSLFDEMEQRFLREGGSYHTGKTRSSANPNDRGPRELRKTAVNPMAPTAVSYRLALEACASDSAESAATTIAAAAATTSMSSSGSVTAVSGESGLRAASARGHVGAGLREERAVAAVGRLPAIVPEVSLCQEGGVNSRKMEELGTRLRMGLQEAGNAASVFCDDEQEILRSADPRFAARALSLVRKMAGAGIRVRRETVALAQQACAGSGRVAAAVEIRQVATGSEDRETDEFLGQWRRRR